MNLFLEPFSSPFTLAFRKLVARKRPARSPRHPREATFEPLENRRLFSTFTVTSTADSGAGSLRAAVISANANPGSDTIAFSASAFPSASLTTISLSSVLEISDTAGSLAISGPAPGSVSISGQNASRIFLIDAGATATFTNLTLASGSAITTSQFSANGGAIYVQGTLTLNTCSVINSTAQGSDGQAGATGGGKGGNGSNASGGAIAVANNATLTVNQSTLTGNVARAGSGGNGGNASNNGASDGAHGGDGGNGGFGYGGAIAVLSGGFLTVSQSTLSGNTAIGGNGGSAGAADKGIDNAFSGIDGGAGGYGGLGGKGGKGDGGAVSIVTTGSIALTQSTISGNSALGGNGGLAGTNGNGGKSSTNGVGGVGGGRWGGGNGGNALGGGVFDSAAAYITNCTLSANSATAGTGGNGQNGGSGGNNTPGTHGGPGIGGDGTPGGNGGSAYGGAVVNYGNLTITQSTLVNNSLASGGGGSGGSGGAGGTGFSSTGVGGNGGDGGNTGNAQGAGFADANITDVLQSTIASNHTSANQSAFGAPGHGSTSGNLDGTAGHYGSDTGGGILSFGNESLSNTLVAGNHGSLAGNSDVSGALVSSSSYNLISDGSGGLINGTGGAVGNILSGTPLNPTNAHLGALANNGGPTLTLAPLVGSPAVDAGSNLQIPTGFTTDQTGGPRLANGRVDIGAVEFEVASPTTTTLTLAPQSAPLGSPVTFTASVQGLAGPASGTVAFTEGSATLGTANLVSGIGTFTTSTLSIGYHTIAASFVGNSAFNTSSAPAQALLIGTANQRYVNQLYVDLFKRSADAGGLAAWSTALDGGQIRAQVATAITSSREYDGIVVDAFYFNYLGRHAEAGGLNAWIDQMQTGLNAEVIRAGILASQEYYNDTGGTDAAYVTALYRTFLSRAPDAGGLSAWEAILADPTQRQTVASGISNSDENRTAIITSFYQTYLHRAPDDLGLAAWKGQLASGISQPAIISFFVTTPEYLSYNHIA